MLTSEMTDDQVDDLANKLRDAARKHRGEISKDVMQQVLGTPNLSMQLYAVIRTLAEEISKQVVHIVAVDRKRTPKAALDASGRKQYTTKAVVDAMPHGTGNKVRLMYFKPDKSAYKNGWLSCDALDVEYEKRNLVPDPQAQIDDNAANLEFANEVPNACQWKDDDGNWYYATFGRWDGERNVSVFVCRYGYDWRDRWWFAGVPAS